MFYPFELTARAFARSKPLFRIAGLQALMLPVTKATLGR
jgi:hypothetical protein